MGVSGTFTPVAGGQVSLQRQFLEQLAHAEDHQRISTGTYAISATVGQGSFLYRIVKEPTLTIAPGFSKTFRLGVDSPSITTATLPKGAVGVPYDQPLAAEGGGPAYTFAAAPLPAGLTMSTAGVISGRPKTLATTALTVTVTDAKGLVGAKAFTLVVSPVTVLSAGDNRLGDLANGTTVPSPSFGPTLLPAGSVESVSDVYEVGVALKTDGTVWTWGKATLALETGVANPFPRPGALAAGCDRLASTGYGAMALLPDGTVWAWGPTSTVRSGTAPTRPGRRRCRSRVSAT